jgi:phenylalanyl-tRNA synthetase alpha chain
MKNDIAAVQQSLEAKIATHAHPREVLKDPSLKKLYKSLKDAPADQKAALGLALNTTRQQLESLVKDRERALGSPEKPPIDVTAPCDINSDIPHLLPSSHGSQHPISGEINRLTDIFYRMGYVVEESREIDDQYHMFETLNFPKGHPARDDYDTFMTVERDAAGHPLIAHAHTSTMQNRVLRKYHSNLENDEAIAVIVPDRVFRNEDLDARHEHTFYQIEGVYVAKDVNVGNLIATLQEFLQEYYGQQLDVRVNPFYFPFTEPSFEFALSCPFCNGKENDCKVCSGEGWVELLGCGMIHPNVLQAAEIDPSQYTGFAFGCGIDRLIMMKYQIEDIRHLHSAKLDFLRQF